MVRIHSNGAFIVLAVRCLDRAGLVCTSAAMFFAASTACADDFIVYSPYVLATQTEIELRGYQTEDAGADHRGSSASELSVAHAFSDWWRPELYIAKYEKTLRDGGHLIGYEFENTFQLTQPGEQWLDYGFVASYERKTRPNTPDAVEFGPIFVKTMGRFTNTVNLIWEKQVGAGASGKYEFRYSYSGTYAMSSVFRPGLEAYARPADHAYQAGPIARGEWHVPGTQSNLEYRVGLVFGLNDAAPRRTWLAQIEYEYF